jgi:hypothetical protein
MTGFLLKIFFSGLIVFVPSQQGKEVTVLLVNLGHDYQLSDGTTVPHHKPLLLARGGSCVGDCPTRDAGIANFLYSDQPETAVDALEQAVTGGGAWELGASDLTIRKGCSRDGAYSALSVRENARTVVDGQPDIIPTTAAEREDFSWVTQLRKLCPTGCDLNPALLGPQPPAGLVAARLHLRGGTLFTYAIARNGSNVMPVQFERLDGVGGPSPYEQAIATWVEADINISGTTVEISEQSFDGTPGRSMSLAPNAQNIVEVAVLNLPPFAPPPAAGTIPHPGAGKHFEAYYDLLQTPPAKDARAVPQPVSFADNLPVVSWDDVQPRQPLYSELLSRLRLDLGRTAYDKTLCPMVQY